VAREPDRKEAGLNLFIGLLGLALAVIGLSDSPSHEKYRLMWPVAVLALCIAILAIGVLGELQKKVLYVRSFHLTSCGPVPSVGTDVQGRTVLSAAAVPAEGGRRPPAGRP
jgi:hypothetical protein